MDASPTDPWYVDPAGVDPRALRLVAAFRDALARVRDEHGLTFEDVSAVTTVLEQVRDGTGAPLSMVALPLFGDVFQGEDDGYTPSDDVESPTYLPGSPLIDNPGTLPMRPDEPGDPLVVSGRVLDGRGDPLVGAEMSIYHTDSQGVYAGIHDDGRPTYNLRGRQITDDQGGYAFRTITPVPYYQGPPDQFDALREALAVIGRSVYRPAHIHYEIRHPDLVAPYRGEVYFAGDPVIPLDFIGPGFAVPSLQAVAVRHEDPDDMAAHGFDRPFTTAEFDFVLRTRHSPAGAGRR